MLSDKTRKLVELAKGLKLEAMGRGEPLSPLVACYDEDQGPLALFAFEGTGRDDRDESLASALWAMREGLDVAAFRIIIECRFLRNDILDPAKEVVHEGLLICRISRHYSHIAWLGFTPAPDGRIRWDENHVTILDDPDDPKFPIRYQVQAMLAQPRHFASSPPTRQFIFEHLRGSSLASTTLASLRSMGFELLGVDGFRFADLNRAEREFASRN